MKQMFLFLWIFLSIVISSLEAGENKNIKKNIKEECPSSLVDPAPDGYRTPRAGEAFQADLFGMKLDLPARDRNETFAMNVIGIYNSPTNEDSGIQGVGGLFYKKIWKDKRIWAFMVGVVHQVIFGKDLDPSGSSEGLILLDTLTLPFATGETFNRKSVKETEIYEGYLRLSLGVGWKRKLVPCQVENILSIGILYEPGFSYFKDSSNTDNNYILPPSTYEHRARLMVRIDAFLRNLLEMRHRGWAAGMDLSAGRRENWRDHGFNRQEREKDTQEYLLFTAYWLGATGLPFLSEKYRFLGSVYYGYSPNKLDRYSALPLGSSSSADDSEALSNPILWGASLQEFRTREYFIATAEVRYEILFFLYGHLRLSGGWMRFRNLDTTGLVHYQRTPLGAFSVGLSSGFLWNSVLIFDYGYNWELKKDGKRGTQMLVVRWSKAF